MSADRVISSVIDEEVTSTLSRFKHRSNLRAAKLRHEILGHLKKLGWSDSVRIHENSKISVTSMKDRIALCFQTGNMGRFYADLLKLETLFRNGRIVVAIYIIPMRTLSRTLGSNVANYERFVEELNIFRVTLTVPIIVLGIESEG